MGDVPKPMVFVNKVEESETEDLNYYRISQCVEVHPDNWIDPDNDEDN